MNKLIGALILAMLVVSCAKDPEQVNRTENPNFEVDTLFTHSGCTIYRFNDAGHYHYFAKCRGTAETISEKSESCGKGCVTTWDENIISR